METVFLAVLILSMAFALASGYPVAFALPGSAILSIGLAALTGYLFEGNTDAYFSHGGPTQWLNAGVTNFRGIYWEVERDTLIAIPLFVFMGIMLERSKVAEDLLVTMAQLFGPIPGGLGIAVVFVGALLAATTGIVGATVIAMGLISLPVMLRNNYSRPLAAGTISASGTLGQIIPPSIVLIILADQLSNATDQASTLRTTEYKQATGQFNMPTEFDLTSTSAGDMFVGALLPGLVLVGLYMIYILVLSLLRPGTAPPVPFQGSYDWRFVRRVLVALVPPLTLILLVLGSIIMGIATVNQAGAIGAVGALLMAGYRLKAGEKGAFVPGLLAIAAILVMAGLLYFVDINIKSIKSDDRGIRHRARRDRDRRLSGGRAVERVARLQDRRHAERRDDRDREDDVAGVHHPARRGDAHRRVPRLRRRGRGARVPDRAAGRVLHQVRRRHGGDLHPRLLPRLHRDRGRRGADHRADPARRHLGQRHRRLARRDDRRQHADVVPDAALRICAVLPARRRAARGQTTQIYLGVVPFILLQLVALGIVGVFPALVNYLPNRVYLGSETAPPPKNPRLQLCLEDHLFAQYDARQDALRQSIATARRLDLSYLPDARRRVFAEGLDAADATFGTSPRCARRRQWPPRCARPTSRFIARCAVCRRKSAGWPTNRRRSR